jgi:hypothetical protein
VSAASWHEANQRYLAAQLDRVRAALERHAAARRPAARGGAPEAGEAEPGEHERAAAAELAGAAAELPAPAALDRLCALFHLSSFERDVLVLCAGVELDGQIGPLCAAAQGEPGRPHPTFGLALAALPSAHWSALAPAAPLRRWRLVEVVGSAGGYGLTTSPLRVDERVLHFLAGVPHLDERLEGLIEPLEPADPGELVPSHRAMAARLAELWARPGGPGPPAAQLGGADRLAKRQVAAVAAASLGLRLARMAWEAVPTAAVEQEGLRRLWEREAALSGSALLFDAEGLDPADSARVGPLVRFLERLDGLLVVASREPLPFVERPAARLEVGPPAAAERRSLWRSALGPLAEELDGRVEALATQFNLGAQAIRLASAEALGRPEGGLWPGLWDACRAQARSRLDDLARRIEPAATWDDLVLPAPQRQTLHEIVAHVRQRATVYERWGFGAKSTRGLGISALFAGASGTGKTMAAEVLANELRLDLYQIDLSAVVSKYIGETEKNLRRVFDAAEEGAAILLFDEADALFGKRSEVKDSHDRYANIEVGYLLQRMEAYRGLAILTTNNKTALDPAFLRRLRFVVQFPFPDASERVEIWRRVFPAETPTAELDLARLGRLNVAGGNIRNIALGAAFLAADAGEAVGMPHLLRAARSEYAKLEKTLTEAEVGGWA